MPNKIFKYVIHHGRSTPMPIGAEILMVASQGGRETLWAKVDTDAMIMHRTFKVLGTGATVPPGAQHVGSFMESQSLVGHVYETT